MEHLYLTVEEALHSDQSRAIGEAEYTYSLVEKTFKKLTKTTKIRGKNKLKPQKC